MIPAALTRGPDTVPDKAVFARWYAGRGNRVQTVETLYGTMWRALPEETRRTIERQFPNAGEESIREFAARVADVLPRDDQILVLFEEEKVKRMTFGKHVHLLHTWAFLMAPERMGVIPSADDLHRQIAGRGRTIARDVYERCASAEGGDAQDWTEDYDRRSGP